MDDPMNRKPPHPGPLLLGCCLFASAMSTCWGQNPVNLTTINDHVEVQSAAGLKQVSSIVQHLEIGNGVRTRSRSLAILTFPNKDEVRLDRDTTVDVRGRRELFISRGTIYTYCSAPLTLRGPGVTIRNGRVAQRAAGDRPPRRAVGYADYALTQFSATPSVADTSPDPVPDAPEAPTEFEVEVAGNTTSVRCYAGVVSLFADGGAVPQYVDAGFGLTFQPGTIPTSPHPIFPKAFAGGDEHPWFQQVVPDTVVQVYNDTITQEVVKTDRQATGGNGTLKGNSNAPFPSPPQPSTPTPGTAVLNINARRPRTSNFQIPAAVGSGTGGEIAGGTGLSGGALLAALAESGAVPPALALPSPAGLRGAIGRFDLEPYVVGASGGDTVGAQARLRVADGNLLGTLGGIVRHYRDHDYTDVSEASVLYRTPNAGDFRVGRQLLFLGPANNDRVGSLLISYTVDGVTWDDTAGRRLGWRLGYLRNSGPLGGDNFPGGFGRVQSLLGKGVVGATVLEAHRNGDNLGASADISEPLLPRLLNGYMEAGRDPFRRHLFTGGLSFPGLFHSSGLDLFLEYQTRTGYQDEYSLRLSSQVRRDTTAIGYLVKTRGGDTSGGVALQFGVGQ